MSAQQGVEGCLGAAAVVAATPHRELCCGSQIQLSQLTAILHVPTAATFPGSRHQGW